MLKFVLQKIFEVLNSSTFVIFISCVNHTEKAYLTFVLTICVEKLRKINSQSNNEVKLEAHLEGETVGLTQEQITELS